MNSFVPSDDALLQDIIRIQSSQGAEIGLQKIYDHMKAEHPRWMFGMKRLRAIRKTHNLAPVPPGSNAKGEKELDTEDTEPLFTSEPDTLKLQLQFRVPNRAGGRDQDFLFERAIPTAYCQQGASRDVTSEFLSRVTDECEKELLTKRLWTCGICEKPATFFYGVPCVSLVDRPPSVMSISMPICSMQSNCTQEVLMWVRNGLQGLSAKQTPGGGFEVHTPLR